MSSLDDAGGCTTVVIEGVDTVADPGYARQAIHEKCSRW